MVLAAENDETRQTVNLLVACLVGIAVCLAALTVWYWFHTDPKRRRQATSPNGEDTEIIEARADEVLTEDRMAGAPPDDEAVRFLVPVAGRSGQRAARRGTEEADDGSEAAMAQVDGADEVDEADGSVRAPLMARQTWDFVAAAKRAEDGGRPTAPPPPAAPRIAVAPRSGLAVADEEEADELAVVRRRREQEAARGLSDEVWDSIRRSVFDKLDG